jgi:hypothetical protein
MARSQHVGLVRSNADINVAIENVVRWHIQAVRRTKNGSITQVKHIQWGWMSVANYYQLQKIHDVLPILEKVIEGGYRLKAAIWQQTVTVNILASGTDFPFAMILITVAVILAGVDAYQGRNDLAFWDIAALALPFGEIWLLYHGLDTIYNLLTGSTATAVYDALTNQVISRPPTPQEAKAILQNIYAQGPAVAKAASQLPEYIQYNVTGGEQPPASSGGSSSSSHHGHSGGGNQAG